MKIAIIGTGNVGGALATRFSEAGHEIFLGVRNPASFKGMEYLSHLKNAEISSIEDAVIASEVIVISTPAHIVTELITTLGDLSGKVVIDATNAVRMKPDPYQNAYEALKALTKADVVKCFNSTGYENMTNPTYRQNDPVMHHVRLDMYMAGGSDHSKAIAKALAIDAGFATCIDFGGDDKVQLLEQFALCWINLAIMQGMGRNIAFKIIHRDN